MPIEFALPSLGENVAGGDVLKVLVKPGDMVEADQPVLELETDKATIEVPSGVAGRVIDVRVKEGEKITVGQVVLSVEDNESAKAPAAPTAPQEAAPRADAAAAGLAVEQDEEAPVEAAPAPETATPEAAGTPATPSVAEFALPELGENVAGGDVLRVMVKPGDTVAVDQPVLELETDKATIEVPSTVAGRVTEVHVTQGEKVTIGQVIFLIESSDTGITAAPAQQQPVKSTSPSPSAMPDEGMHQHVGGTIRSPVVDKPGMLEHALEEAAADGTPRTELPARSGVVDMGRGREGDQKRSPAPASPSVRRAARELGVDIYQVKGTGPGGRISADDVKVYVKSMMSGGGPKGAVTSGGGAQTPLPDFSKFGSVERKPMRGVRRKTAEHLSNAWVQIPHVTQCDLADLTALEDLRKQFGSRAEAAGGKLTVTAVALKVIAAALKQFPQFNSSVDMSADEVVYKKYINIGVAVDTERGLLVPVIRDVDKKNIVELSVELQQVSERARTGKMGLDEMQGGCFTITNLGGIGGTYFTPIVNLPEVAILGMSRAAMQPVWKAGEFVPRLMLPLSLSYDHRVIDGADGIRFLRFVCEALEEPFLLSLAG